MSVANTPIKVIYIMAWGRSGSTLLGNLLGEIDDFFHAGELRTIWEKGLLRGRLCGCGQRVPECSFWQDVMGRGFGQIDVKAVCEAQRSAARLRHAPRLLRGHPGNGLPGGDDTKTYASSVVSLYRALGKATGARVIVDSSKREADAALLRLLDGIEPYYVHLVRDPRAVAYSWQRRKATPEPRGEMVTYKPSTSTRNWLGLNVTAEAIRRRVGRDRYLFVRYEDLITGPRDALESIVKMVEEWPARLPVNENGAVKLTRNHTAGGNPGRFHTGPVPLRLDDEWVALQPRSQRLVATTIAMPLLHRYRYPWRPRLARSR
ncbi:MAG: sulfotransferase [Actinomycetota bacterium]